MDIKIKIIFYMVQLQLLELKITSTGKMVWYYNNARGRPEKKKIISSLQGYHGVTVASASLTGLPNNHRDFDLPTITDRVGSGPRPRGTPAYIRHLPTSPRNLSSLIRLGRASKRASASLTTFMAAFMEAHSTLTNEIRILETA